MGPEFGSNLPRLLFGSSEKPRDTVPVAAGNEPRMNVWGSKPKEDLLSILLDVQKQLHSKPEMAFPIEIRPSLLEEERQFRFPKSKKSRIRKKWRKDRRNWRNMLSTSVLLIPEINLIGMTDTGRTVMLMHPNVANLLKTKLTMP